MTTYRVVWRPFLGGSETLAEGLTAEQAEAELTKLNQIAPLPTIGGIAFGGSYGLEVEEPHPAGDAPALAVDPPAQPEGFVYLGDAPADAPRAYSHQAPEGPAGLSPSLE